MSVLRRSWRVATVGVIAITVIAIATTSVGAKSSGRATSGTVYAAITHKVGNIQFVAGNFTDKVLGKGAATFALTVGTGSKPGTVGAKGTVTAWTTTGSLSGADSVDITVSSSGALTFTNGKLNLNHGTGGQKGHSFVGTVTGSAPSASGPFVFHEKGTYK